MAAEVTEDTSYREMYRQSKEARSKVPSVHTVSNKKLQRQLYVAQSNEQVITKIVTTTGFSSYIAPISTILNN